MNQARQLLSTIPLSGGERKPPRRTDASTSIGPLLRWAHGSEMIEGPQPKGSQARSLTTHSATKAQGQVVITPSWRNTQGSAEHLLRQGHGEPLQR